MKNLKIKSAILALSLGLMQLLYSCGAASDTDAVETTLNSSETDESTEETEPDVLEGLDLGGETIRFYTSISDYDYETSNNYIEGSGEENGDAVNDAVYYRNLNTEEKLNVKLEFIQTDQLWDTIGADIQKTVWRATISTTSSSMTCIRSLIFR